MLISIMHNFMKLSLPKGYKQRSLAWLASLRGCEFIHRTVFSGRRYRKKTANFDALKRASYIFSQPLRVVFGFRGQSVCFTEVEYRSLTNKHHNDYAVPRIRIYSDGNLPAGIHLVDWVEFSNSEKRPWSMVSKTELACVQLSF